MVQDAGFSAQVIWRYSLGTTSGIQLITGENHVTRLGMMPRTEVTTGASGRGARWWAPELVWHSIVTYSSNSKSWAAVSTDTQSQTCSNKQSAGRPKWATYPVHTPNTESGTQCSSYYTWNLHPWCAANSQRPQWNNANHARNLEYALKDWPWNWYTGSNKRFDFVLEYIEV